MGKDFMHVASGRPGMLEMLILRFYCVMRCTATLLPEEAH
jgi:hypothetical protein